MTIRVLVADDQACGLPQDSEIWAAISRACFMWDGQPVPVVDTSRLFTRSPS